MTPKRPARKFELTPQQREEHARIRKSFATWQPSPEEFIAGGASEQFTLSGEYRYLRPFLADLKQVREQAGLSLADVSRRCGVDKAALSRLENGHNANPTLDTLWRYAAALGRRLLLESEVITPTAGADVRPVKNGKQVGTARGKRERG